MLNNEPCKNLFMMSLIFLVDYKIWEMKLQKSLVPMSVFMENLKGESKNMLI